MKYMMPPASLQPNQTNRHCQYAVGAATAVAVTNMRPVGGAKGVLFSKARHYCRGLDGFAADSWNGSGRKLTW